MAYLSIGDFKYGMDRRRPRSVGIPGTLWNLRNAFIGRGGDIERCMKFVPVYEVPGTVGLAELEGGIVVFGEGDKPANLPAGVRYRKIPAFGSAKLTRILDARRFDDELYVVGRYDSGNVIHHYGNQRIDAWRDIAIGIATLETVVRRFETVLDGLSGVQAIAFDRRVVLTSGTPGTPFVVQAETTDLNASGSAPVIQVQTTTPNRVERDEVPAEARIQVTAGAPQNQNRLKSLKTDGIELLYAPVVALASDEATANAIAVSINNATDRHGYYASTVEGASDTVQIYSPPGSGTSKNGDTVTIVTGGDVEVEQVQPFQGGLAAQTAQAQVVLLTFSCVEFDATDQWIVRVDGAETILTGIGVGTGSGAFVTKQRIFSWADTVVRYSGLNGPLDWIADDKDQSGNAISPAIDAGFFLPGTDSIGSKQITAMASYGAQTAIFSPDVIRIYNLSTDAEEFASAEPIQNTGTISPRTVIQYGNVDVYYLDSSGVRSLRSREQSGEAYASDVGSAIDVYLQDMIRSLPQSTIVDAQAIISPQDGRYMLAIGDTIVCLSLYPSNKITAWSVLELGFPVDYLIRTTRDVFIRSGDRIYQYGGPGRNQYPDDGELPVLAETAFMSANDPAGMKQLTGADADCRNAWRVDVLIDPADENLKVEMGTVTGPTWRKAKIKLPGQTTHVAFRMVCDTGGPATFSAFAIHYDKAAGE